MSLSRFFYYLTKTPLNILKIGKTQKLLLKIELKRAPFVVMNILTNLTCEYRLMGEKAELEVIKKAGHVPQIEFPERFNAIVYNFLCA